MLAMNNEGFPLFKRRLAVHRSRLWLASQALAQVSGTHHIARQSCPCDRSKAGYPLDRLFQGKRSLSFMQKWQRTSPIITSYSTAQDTPFWLTRRWPCQGCRQGLRFLAFGAQEVPPEWVYICVYLLLAVLQEYIYSISCLGLLLTRDLFGSCPWLLGVVEQAGDWEVWEPKPSARLRPPLDLKSRQLEVPTHLPVLY